MANCEGACPAREAADAAIAGLRAAFSELLRENTLTNESRVSTARSSAELAGMNASFCISTCRHKKN